MVLNPIQYLVILSTLVAPTTLAQSDCGFNLEKCRSHVATYGERYYHGDILCSKNRMFQFGIAADGNLLFCKNNVRIWSAKTCCTENDPYLHHNQNGNVVVYGTKPNGDKLDLWSSGTGNTPNTALYVGNNGVVRVTMLSNFTYVWQVDSNGVEDRIEETEAEAEAGCGFDLSACVKGEVSHIAEYGRKYFKGDFLCARNGRYQFGLSADGGGNLLLCDNNVKIWSAIGCCEGHQDYFLQHNALGNAVVYGFKPNDKDNKVVLWSSGTGNTQSTALVVGNNGAARVMSVNDGAILWRTTDDNNGVHLPVSAPHVPPSSPSSSEGYCGFDLALCDNPRCHVAQYGREYYHGDILCSRNGEYQFGIDGRGNLLLCKNNQRIWSANTCCGRHDPYFRHDRDGNMVVYGTEENGDRVTLWSTGTGNTENTALVIANRGVARVMLTDGSETTLWKTDEANNNNSAPTSSPVSAGEIRACTFTRDACLGNEVGLKTTLVPGDHVCSSNGRYRFGLDLTANLVLCDRQELTWVKESGATKTELTLQNSGNLVLKKNGSRKWSTSTAWMNVKSLKLYNNGVIQLEKKNGSSLWSIASGESVFQDSTSTDTTEDTSTSTDEEEQQEDGSETGVVTYEPGNLVYDKKSNLFLSKGLVARRFGKTGERVTYPNGSRSDERVHIDPDGGACFDSPDEAGGFIYVSNEEENPGGVGAFTFNQKGQVTDYKMILRGTKVNCGGGKTPWGTWLSGEEIPRNGHFWEVHPTGSWKQKTAIGGQNGAKFESATFDDRNIRELKVFATCDRIDGELRRFRPNPTVLNEAVNSGNYRRVLSAPGGLIDYLVLVPVNNRRGTFKWTTNKVTAMNSAQRLFPNSEGIDHHDGLLFFISKERHLMYILDLDRMTYTSTNTSFGKFNGQPDQILHSIDPYNEKGLIYFTEDGGDNAAGIFAKDHQSKRYAILVGGGGLSNESTGFAICDKGRKMITAFQDGGELYVIEREDGLKFEGTVANLKYHESTRSSVYA